MEPQKTFQKASKYSNTLEESALDDQSGNQSSY